MEKERLWKPIYKQTRSFMEAKDAYKNYKKKKVKNIRKRIIEKVATARI